MTDLVARLRLEASAGNTSQVLGAAARDTAQVGVAGTKAAAGMREAQTATAGFERSAGGARAAGAALGAALGLIGGRELVGQLKEAAFAVSGLNTGLSAVTGGAYGAADAQDFVREQSERLGLVIRETTAGYLQLAAATNGTALAGQKTKDIWLGLNEAGTVLNLSQEKQKLAMEAISQIANKGVVSQEELRQQLAESLPGAYQVAARSMGMTTQEFGKLVDSGKLLSEDFLPQFAAQLSKEFGPKVDAALTKPIGQARLAFADFKNTTDGLTATAGAAFLEGLTSGLQSLNAELGSSDTKEAAQALGKSLGEGLGNAAEAATFLVDHLDQVEAAAGAVVAIGLAKWLVSTATEARGAAAAYLAKAEAAKASGAITVTTAQGEVVAVSSLRGAIVAAAQAEVTAAAAARDLALANEQGAAAALAQARAQAANLTSTLSLAEKKALVAVAERDLAAAQTATTAASARAQVAAGALATATTAGGAAAQGAKALFGGLMGMLGGPWGIALLAAGAAVAYVGNEIAEADARAREAYVTQHQYATAMAQAAEALGDAATNTRVFGADTANAVDPTDKLTGSTRQLTDQTLKLADARRQAALGALQETDQKLRGELKDLDKAGRGVVKVQTGVSPDGSPVYSKILASARRDQINDELAANMSARIQLAIAKPAPEAKPPATTTVTTTDKDTLRAQNRAGDLEAARLAQEAYTQALVAGGVALDDWKVKEAGRQAVERLALADRPKLTAAEQALVGQIRARAEETERLKIANERIEKAIGLRKTAEADTAALQRRSAAAIQGEAALEALQVKEAGLEALQQLGVDTLDQLTGATLDHAKAAVAAAEAKEKQLIATAKAERVADQIRDLDQRTASEIGYARAVAGGTEALVAYQREEFVRQELDRAGKTLTDDQVAAIRAKAEALFAAGAAADSADLTKRQAEELRLARMTNAERAVEERYLQRKSLLLAEHSTWTKDEVEARARALALADEAAAQDAKAIGDLKDGLKQAFIESGHLGFEDVGDFVERRLREAVYNALLAKPIDILINAVVGSVSGMNALQSGSGLGQLGGTQGLGSLFTSAGALKGLSSVVGQTSLDVLGKLGYSGLGAAKLAGGLGAAAGGAGTGMLVSSVAGMLGIKQTSGSQIGSTIGGAIGSFIPIPGGAIIGSIAGNLIGGLVGGKASNHAAVATLDAKGNVVSMDGAKRTDQTTAAAQQVAQSVAQIQAALEAGGATLSATVSKIDIGTRDSTHLNFSNGTSIDTAVGDVSAAIDAATKTILAGAKWGSEAQTAYAQKLLAAGATIDQVIASMQVAADFSGSIDDAIAQLTDPAVYAKKQALAAIDENYQALKKQAQELIAAGIATGDVLGKLDQLKDLQVVEALKNLGQAADEASAKLAGQAGAGDFSGSINDAILQIVNPTAAKLKSALDQVEKDYKSRIVTAQSYIAAGLLTSDVLGQIETLRQLEIDQTLTDLSDSVSTTTDAFKEAAPKLKSWLDGLVGSSSNELSPQEELAAARSQYDRQLALARSGDSDALSSITSYADRLLAADREVNGDAASRRALYDQVTGQVAALEQMRASTVAASNDVASTLKAIFGGSGGDNAFGVSLKQSLATQPITLNKSIDFVNAQVTAQAPLVDKVLAAIVDLKTTLASSLRDVVTASSAANAAIQERLEGALNTVSSSVDALASTTAQQAEALDSIGRETNLSSIWLRQKIASAV
ncbi:tape measure protein [Caulobacter sp. BP25]|uniref:tape measure protein n=1 Tax=Caulobacter sp. BP25 TaxID=2048900 RepID=UPI000C12A36D|nr:tape measure protein [Caulobacter sp. BP25]PHY20818.1 hypothetical protein CSW59_06230 [Caulobacter sp. BP25]